MKIDELARIVVAENSKLPEASLQAFENALDYDLPWDFRTFLWLTGGGGKVELEASQYLAFKNAGEKYSPFTFCRPAGEDYHDIRALSVHLDSIEQPCAGVPKGIFTIADDFMGNFLTIDLRQRTFGEIALIDHETIGESFTDTETYRVIASSFSEFVRHCTIHTEYSTFTLGSDEKIQIHSDRQIGELIERAQKLRKNARLQHGSDDWIEFHPLPDNGYVFRKYSQVPTIYQGYYKRKTSLYTNILPFIQRAFEKNPKVIQTQHVTIMFEDFLLYGYTELGIMFERTLDNQFGEFCD